MTLKVVTAQQSSHNQEAIKFAKEKYIANEPIDFWHAVDSIRSWYADFRRS